MPLSYPVVFICEVPIPELVVDCDGFDLRCAAVIAETPHERAADDPIRGGRQPILPEVSIAATCLRRDDGEDGAVTGTLVERDPHRHRRFTLLAGQYWNTLGARHVSQPGLSDCVDPQATLEAFSGYGDIQLCLASLEPVFDVNVVRPIERTNSLPGPPVEPKGVQRAAGRSDLVSPDDEAARRILRVDPHRRIVSIVGHRSGLERGRDRWRRSLGHEAIESVEMVARNTTAGELRMTSMLAACDDDRE